MVVHGASHSWLLKDPETLPAVMLELMRGPARHRPARGAVMAAGVDPDGATLDELESVFFEPDALRARLLDRRPSRGTDREATHQRPRYRWTDRRHPARAPPARRASGPDRPAHASAGGCGCTAARCYR